MSNELINWNIIEYQLPSKLLSGVNHNFYNDVYAHLVFNDVHPIKRKSVLKLRKFIKEIE